MLRTGIIVQINVDINWSHHTRHVKTRDAATAAELAINVRSSRIHTVVLLQLESTGVLIDRTCWPTTHHSSATSFRKQRV